MKWCSRASRRRRAELRVTLATWRGQPDGRRAVLVAAQGRRRAEADGQGVAIDADSRGADRSVAGGPARHLTGNAEACEGCKRSSDVGLQRFFNPHPEAATAKAGGGINSAPVVPHSVRVVMIGDATLRIEPTADHVKTDPVTGFIRTYLREAPAHGEHGARADGACASRARRVGRAQRSGVRRGLRCVRTAVQEGGGTAWPAGVGPPGGLTPLLWRDGHFSNRLRAGEALQAVAPQLRNPLLPCFAFGRRQPDAGVANRFVVDGLPARTWRLRGESRIAARPCPVPR